MKILVLDGNSILNRAFYGIKLLTTKDGLYTNAIYGFMNILLKLESEQRPDETAIAFDLKGPTFRHEMYAGYKAHRKGMPEELAAQMPLLKELLCLLGYRLVSKEGYEADDILGTIAKAAQARGDEALLATGDRDSLQLVDEGVNVLLTTTKQGHGETTRIDKAAILEKYGLAPKQLIDVKALMGDASDNIPGVAGIGEKTALALVQKFGSLSGVYANLNDASIKPAARAKLEAGREMAQASYQLAEICCETPVNTAPGAYRKDAADGAAAAALLGRLEMYSLAQRLGLNAAEAQTSFLEPQQQVNETAAQILAAPLEGRVLFAPVNDEKGQPTGCWLLVPEAEQAVYTAEEASPLLLEALLCEKAEIYAFDSKPLHRLALAAGKEAAISLDIKLAAYLLNPLANLYTVQRLGGEYAVKGAFACPEYPDAPLLWPLARLLEQKVDESGMGSLLRDIEQPLAQVLASMENQGIQLDGEGLGRFGHELRAEMQRQLETIYEQAGGEFNVNSPKQLGEVLFDRLKLPTGRKTKSGWSTDAETLEGLRRHSPIVEHILLYRTYQKLNSTYVEGLLKALGPDGRIHSTFNQTEARTGRISSLEPNMQNIPVRTELGSRLRAYFTAPKGSTFADADYSQIELRILAHISGDEAMREAFAKGEDIHRATAAKVNGLPLNMVTPQMRSAAKAVNFGIVYGIGAFSLSKDIGVSVKEADEFIKAYLHNFPGVKAYMENTVATGREKGYITTLFARRRPLPELASSNRNIQALGQRIAMNTPIQGTAADMIKIAMVRVWRRLRKEGLKSRLILQVHDELIVEAALDEVAAVKALLKEEMEHAAQLSVPLTVDVHTGANWLEAKG